MFILDALNGKRGSDDRTLGMQKKKKKRNKMEGMFVLDALNSKHGSDDRTLGMREENRKKK